MIPKETLFQPGAEAVARVHSAALDGIQARPVTVEADLIRAGHALHIIGLPDAAIRESRSRVLQALRTVPMPNLQSEILVNLAPAMLRKEGTALDLPIALAAVARVTNEYWPRLDRWLVAGEIGLDGRVTRMQGALLIAVLARRLGVEGVIVPSVSVDEAAVVDGVAVRGVEHLNEAVVFLRDGRGAPARPGRAPDRQSIESSGDEWHDVRGQESAKRGLLVAAAGGHNVLMVGPPGAGKTMMARLVPRLLPMLTVDEALEVACIHAGSSLPRSRDFYLSPFRAPHHSTSRQALVGGGVIPRPGEVSLSHRGVLFLDEFPEFSRDVLEVLRQPLEDGSVTIARARESRTYPARFMLVAAMNPCPCGYAGDPLGRCRCTKHQIQRYRSQISGPLIDRIDLHLPVRRVPIDPTLPSPGGMDLKSAANLVAVARDRQRHRYAGESLSLNAHLPSRLLSRHCGLEVSLRNLLGNCLRRFGLSARAHVRILRMARTLADLDDANTIQEQHLVEAIHYRWLDREEREVSPS